MAANHEDVFYDEFYDDYIDCIDDYFKKLEPGARFTTEEMVEELSSLQSPFSHNFLYNWVSTDIIKALYEQKKIKYLFRGSYVKVK